jgi:anti-sigma B factor antagonist
MSSFYVVGDDTVVEDVAVITMGGELDYAASPELRERVFAQIGHGRRRLLLDFSDVTFIDSTAIGVIVGAISRLRDSGGGAIAVVCGGDADPITSACPEYANNVRAIFHITGLDSGVSLCSSREEALAELSLGS